MNSGSFKYVIYKNVCRNHVFNGCIKIIWHLTMCNGWYVIKPNQTKPINHSLYFSVCKRWAQTPLKIILPTISSLTNHI